MINLNEGLVADLHIHSRFSRACSKDLTFENLVKWARVKGLNLLGTGDFTHPVWFEEIKKLKSNGNGFYYLDDFPFIITGEVSLIYTDDGSVSRACSESSPTILPRPPAPREAVNNQTHSSLEKLQKEKIPKGRRIHLVVLVPSVEVAEKINLYFDTKGRRDYDGRPIFKIPGDEFVREMKKISSEIEIIPAHCWTPWFGLFGSMSGFDSLKECFKDEIKNIFAIETGMSSDPEMNWRIKEITDNNISIVSFSDSHSFWPWRIGREATIFRKTDSFLELIKQIRENDFLGTIEVDPAYGKYHWDGHRLCNFSCSPSESKKLNNICPVCKKGLVIGVENRVEMLAENSKGFTPKNAKQYFMMLPLHEVLSLFYGMAMASKKIWGVYNNLIEKFGNELNILINISREEFVKENIDEKLVELILRNRKGGIKVKPGYDGEYGVALMGGAKKEEQRKLG